MPKTFALSVSAVALLRFRVKRWRFPVGERDRDAFGELVQAGNMEPDGEDFRFTDGGWARREELLAAAVAHLRGLEPRLPDRVELSRAARRTLARHLAGDHEVTDANRGDYRELARAGIMESVGTFAKGDDCVFQLARQGWECADHAALAADGVHAASLSYRRSSRNQAGARRTQASRVWDLNP